EPEVVLGDVAAQVRADVDPFGGDELRLTDCEPIAYSPVVGGQALAVVVAKQVAVVLVTSGLRDDVDHAAQSPSVLGLVAAEFDFNLLDERVVQGLALVAQLDSGRVDAVNDVLVLQRRGAVDRDAAGLVRARSRCAGRNPGEVAGQGQLLQLLGRG